MPNLLFCMTPGVGLNTWERIGSFNREIKPYIEYARRGWKVKILTFDKDVIPDLPEGIEAVRFPYRHLLWFLPFSHKKVGEWADVIKTNQSDNAFFYTRAAKYWRKPLLLRCGYVHGEYLEAIKGHSPKVKFYQWLEAKAFQRSAHCQVPTEELSRWVQKRYAVPDVKMVVIPNFVETDIFKPIEGIRKKEKSVISIGRLFFVKRFDLLIKACSEIQGCELTIIGEGPERQKLMQLAKGLRLRLNILDNIPNNSLPQLIHQHSVFVITSSWEGHPKALIEAMSCGMPCLGVEAIGVKNIIEHKKNGWLVKSSLDSVVNGIKELFENEELRIKLSVRAREYVLEHYAFNKCFLAEYNVMESLRGTM